MEDEYLKARLVSIEQRLEHLEDFTGLKGELMKLQNRVDITEEDLK